MLTFQLLELLVAVDRGSRNSVMGLGSALDPDLPAPSGVRRVR